ncbi:hypothetical protein [Psychrobacter sp. BF1]|uniref:phage tail fiber protein n=1 Tax=Psychrobacter sp. BF1 TaxID=2821147 RepID=UPI001C4E19EC|nr:hypothetical protein [Psychrobacter sp. BF1]
MAIQIPNLGSGNGLTGDNELVIRQKYNANFTDQTNAASRLVGQGLDDVVVVADIAVALSKAPVPVKAEDTSYDVDTITPRGAMIGPKNINRVPFSSSYVLAKALEGEQYTHVNAFDIVNGEEYWRHKRLGTWGSWVKYHTTANTTKDANGFLKGASPVVDLYDSVMGQNEDAKKQDITFEKVSTGDYLIKGSLGLAQEGWYIETPKDANGNVLVAVVYKQLANNDISVKTYAKRFDEDTGDIVANLTKPRDIPAGRFISLRLHEMPTEPTPPME